MADNKCRGYAGSVPVYCAHDKIVAVGDIKPNPKNPNQHPEEQIKMLAKIIAAQGWRAPVTVSTLSGLVVRGHGRLMAAKFAGLEFVPVDLQHYDSMDAELADLLADNKIAELSDIDNKLLADVFADIDLDAIDVDITGYTETEYNSIVSALTAATQEQETEWNDPDADVAPPKATTTKRGDIWRIGRHRLMCGDSTAKECVDRLMDGAKADMVMTDPPYGINAEKMTMGTGRRSFHRGEDWDRERPDISIAFTLAPLVCIWGGNYFADKLPITNDWLIWHKKNDGLTFSECELAWTNFGVNCRHISHHWGNEKKQHVTMKPVDVIAWAIERAKQKANVIVDLFGGSGTTLVACERLNRTCYTMELDPKYCDVIVRRYVQVTGKRDVVLVRDGKEIPVKDTGILND